MKINYLILAHANYQHLDRLIDALDDEDVNFFIHIDKKADREYHNSKHNVYFVKDRVNIIWGGFGMVEATIKLLRMAHQKIGEGYYCLLSGTDYPVCSNDQIKKELAKGYERINIKPAPLPHKEMDRFEYYHFDFRYRKVMTLSEKIITGIGKMLNLKRDIPFTVYVGSQWFALSHECVSYILKEIRENPVYVDFFRYAKIPDEAFFHTIIGNSRFLQQTKPSITYTDWSTDPAPAMISNRHLEIFKGNSEINGTYGSYVPMFARKFNDQSKPIVEKINRILR